MSEMDNIRDIIKDPYSNISISLLISSKNYDDFLKLYNNLLLSSSGIESIEILVKIDELDKRYFDLLNDGPCKFKVLNYPPYHRRYSGHIFFNDLCKISHGKLIWPLYEDCEIIRGDWYSCLMQLVDDNLYKDNIFNIAIPMDNGKGFKQICGANIVSKEWFDFFGIISPFPNLDRWLSELSRKIGRYVGISEDKLLSHFPKGHRTLSKKQRKELFYPQLEKYIKHFNER
jgi:hypothetical protein